MNDYSSATRLPMSHVTLGDRLRIEIAPGLRVNVTEGEIEGECLVGGQAKNLRDSVAGTVMRTGQHPDGPRWLLLELDKGTPSGHRVVRVVSPGWETHMLAARAPYRIAS